MSCCRRKQNLKVFDESTNMVMIKEFRSKQSYIPVGTDITNYPLFLKWKYLDLGYAKVNY